MFYFHMRSLSTSGAIAVANIIQHESVSLQAENFAFVEARICERSNYSKKQSIDSGTQYKYLKVNENENPPTPSIEMLAFM